MNYKTFIFAFCLSFAAVKAAETATPTSNEQKVKPVQSETNNLLKVQQPIFPDVLGEFKREVKESIDDMNQKIRSTQSVHEQAMQKKKNTAIRREQYLVEKTKMVKDIVEKNKAADALKELEGLLEKNKDAYGNHVLEKAITPLKTLVSSGASAEDEKQVMDQVVNELKSAIDQFEAALKELESEKYRAFLSQYTDADLDDFDKKHPVIPDSAPVAPKDDPETPVYLKTWFLATMGGLLLVAIAVTVLVVMRKKKDATDL